MVRSWTCAVAGAELFAGGLSGDAEPDPDAAATSAAGAATGTAPPSCGT